MENKRSIFDRVKSTVEVLISMDTQIEYLHSENYRQNAYRLGKFIICQDMISDSSGNNRWEWMIYIDFMKHPILMSDEAKKINDFVMGKQEDLLDKYLEP